MALELFDRHGVEAVTVEQICAAAGIGPATFYRHFGTKDGVLFAYRPLFLEAIRTAVSRAPAGTASDQVEAALLDFAEYLEAHADELAMRDRIVAANPVLLPRTLLVQREWEAELTRALAAARGVPDTDPTVWWNAALGLVVIRAAFRRWRGEAAATLRGCVRESLAEARATIATRAAPGTTPAHPDPATPPALEDERAREGHDGDG
ncbi:TetR/AcrR family transcriptional regulator [Geodermatophilus telluris]|uniref:TetR/AcrR family transcriptional regulator n=1 Tax=Geodermatophilus telluris TaxID=1190417 RepID=UPI001587B00A|nr:TetR/AcrR family transcriptional regulator [Geodermatophilus telluris]